MDYFNLGSKLDYPELNAIVYLLRKFKRLTSDLTLGSNRIESDYGVYNVTGGLTSVGGNFILEDTVTISSSDVLLNCFYTFNFTVVDVNLSGTVNRRVVSVTGDTGDNGELSVVLSPDLLESDEVILPEFKVDIVFDEHEYYTPVSSLDITLTVDKSAVSVGEVATVTATVLDNTGSPMEDLTLGFNINGSVVSDVTDSDGVASVNYTGTGNNIWVNVSVSGENVKFYDGEFLTAEFTGNSITFGYSSGQWLKSVGDVIIDWGDGTQSTVNNPTDVLVHTYNDGLSNHDIKFGGEVTRLGDYCFYHCKGLTSISIPSSVTSFGRLCFGTCYRLTSVTIPASVTSLGDYCFKDSGLISVTIPASVTSLGDGCFMDCENLNDYGLYWEGNDIITYDSRKMPNININTIFIIPSGQTANYTAKGYPTAKLIERGESLTLTADKPIIQTTETSTITATLKDTGTPLTSKTLNYIIKHGSTTITSGTKTTDSNGQANITYTGTGIGNVQVIVSYTNIQETYEIKDSIAFDSAILNDAHLHNEYWIKQYSSLVANVTNNGTSIIGGGGGQGYLFNKPSTTTSDLYDWNNNICIEFDVYELIGNPYFQIRDTSNNNGSYFLSSVGATAGSHVKIIFTDENTDNFRIIVDGKEKSPKTISNTDLVRMGFVVSTTTGLTFKNFVVYPI